MMTFASMYIHVSPSSDPYFNLALEEYLFETSKDDFLVIYLNADAVITGKHQNAVAESNSQFLFENKVPLLRRFSGGGTVYHDPGNINFSFITTGENSQVIDFKRFAMPIVSFLKSHGIPATLSKRHDIFINDFKISGHAAHAKKNRALHHGTLLFNSNMEKLSTGLKSNKDKFKSRAVQSVRSPVTNICDHLRNELDINDFVEMLTDYMVRDFSIEGNYSLHEVDLMQIEKLANTKYKSFDWNYGYGPNYTFELIFTNDTNKIALSVVVSKGVIIEINPLDKSSFDSELKSLVGCRHYWPDLLEKLSTIFGVSASKKIIHHFF